MGKLIVADTDTATRTANTPVAAEVLYDTSLNRFFGGDGSVIGGKEFADTSSAQTLTNKTIDGASNTITNAVNTDKATLGSPVATSSIADGAFEDITYPAHRLCFISAGETDVIGTARLYVSQAARTADAGRALGTPPSATTEGLVQEFSCTTGGVEAVFNGAAVFVNNEATQNDNIYCRVFNQSGGPSVVTLTLKGVIL